MKRNISITLFVAALMAAIVPMAPGGSADAQAATVTLKIATLIPTTSQWMRALAAWNQSVREATQNQVQLEFVSLGRTADEATFVSGMDAGTYDGAMLTLNGLKRVAPASLALGAPGLFSEYEQLDRARNAMRADLDSAFASGPNGGYRLVSFIDFGRARLFSKTAVARPADLSGRKLWAGPDDIIGASFASAASAQRVQLPMSGVGRALDGGQVDTLYGSALAVVSLNWHTEQRLRFVSQQTFGFVVGATVLKQSSFNRIPQQYRQVVIDNGVRAHTALARTIRRDDDRNFQAATQRGVTAFDTAAARADWDQLLQRTRVNMGQNGVPAASIQRAQSAR